MTRPTDASVPTDHPRIDRAGGKALIALVGVQTNQFPRAVDLARPFLAAGLPVAIGGFHVSGCLAMLPEMPPEMREAQALGITFFAGEAEERRLDTVLRDAWAGRSAALQFHGRSAILQGEPPPILPRKHVRRTSGSLSSVDPAAAVPTSARSAPSSTCRGARVASGRRTTWSGSSARTSRRASSAFSSPTTISPATATGSRSSTG